MRVAKRWVNRVQSLRSPERLVLALTRPVFQTPLTDEEVERSLIERLVLEPGAHFPIALAITPLQCVPFTIAGFE